MTVGGFPGIFLLPQCTRIFRITLKNISFNACDTDIHFNDVLCAHHVLEITPPTNFYMFSLKIEFIYNFFSTAAARSCLCCHNNTKM